MRTHKTGQKKDVEILAEQVCYSYTPGRNAEQLSDVCITVSRGEKIVILGKNGSGKSTLLKVLAGLFSAQKGELYIGGMNAADPGMSRKIRRRCGVVFQNPDTQFVSSVVEEDIRFGLENFREKEEQIQKKILQALDAVDMAGYGEKSTHLLSGGQKQRIALAGVLALSPQILFFDEVTSMLDGEGKQDVCKVIDKLHREGKTIISVTHDIEEAVQADRVIILERGRIIADGVPEQILTDEAILGSAGLLPPFSVQICQKLCLYGAKIQKKVLTVRELVRMLCSEEGAAQAFYRWMEQDNTYAGEIYEQIKKTGAKRIEENDGAEVRIEENDRPEERKEKNDGAEARREQTGQGILTGNELSYCYAAKTSQERLALNEVSLRIDKGEFIGVLGRTGCGKSTLIQVLAGLLNPDHGAVFFHGRDIANRKFDKKLLRKCVGVVFQFPEYQLFEKTVERDVGFGLDYIGFDKSVRERAVKSSLEKMGFIYDEIKERSPVTLSGGEKRRVAIAGALARNPGILILDEPLAGLDPPGRELLLRQLEECCREGMSVVMISHDLECVLRYAGRIVWMEDGRIRYDGSRRGFFKWQETPGTYAGISNMQKMMKQLKQEGFWNPVKRKAERTD